MIVSIVGCGWFGLELGKKLVMEGHHVRGSTTSPAKLPVLENEGIEPFLIDFTGEGISPADPLFFHCDVLVITIPPKVRSNHANRYIPILQSLILSLTDHAVHRVIFISSTGVYGDVNSRVDETTIPLPHSLSGKTLLEAESLFRQNNSFATTIVRFAGLTGPGRDPANFFSGKKDIPNGRAPVNLIHLDDCCGVCLAILKQQAFGYIINACAPDHPEKMEFYSKCCIRAGIPQGEFSDELLNWKIVDSVYIRALLSYAFSVPLKDFYR